MDPSFFSIAADQDYKKHKKQINILIKTTLIKLAQQELQKMPDLGALSPSSINHIISLLWFKIQPILKEKVLDEYHYCFDLCTGHGEDKLMRLLDKSLVKLKAYVFEHAQHSLPEKPVGLK